MMPAFSTTKNGESYSASFSRPVVFVGRIMEIALIPTDSGVPERHNDDWHDNVGVRSVMLMPSLVCLLGAVDAINRASLQFREAGEGVVGIREQEAVGGRVADNGDRPVANAPFNPIA